MDKRKTKYYFVFKQCYEIKNSVCIFFTEFYQRHRKTIKALLRLGFPKREEKTSDVSETLDF